MDTLTIQRRSKRMRRVRSRDTAPEIALRRLVWALGHRYRTNRRDIPVEGAEARCDPRRSYWPHADQGADARSPIRDAILEFMQLHPNIIEMAT